MTLKKIAKATFFNLLCTFGGTLTVLGAISSCWFFFASESGNRFYLAGGSLLVTAVGYLIYRFAFPKIHKKWTDRY